MARLNMSADQHLWLEFRRYGRLWERADFWRSQLGRNLLAWIAVVGAAANLLLLGVLAGLFAAGPSLDASSRSFAEDSMKTIAGRWNEDDLLIRASPDFDASRSQVFEDYFVQLKGLGPITRDPNCVGAAAISPLHMATMITASYACELDFKSGHAVATLYLDQVAGGWRIDRFYVSANRPPLSKP